MKFTLQLIKLLKTIIQEYKNIKVRQLNQNSKVKSKKSKSYFLDHKDFVIKYIYINVFQLMKESESRSIKHMAVLKELSDTYKEYYDLRIKMDVWDEWELWAQTIFPPYINGYKNFYTGIVGRLYFFSIDLEKQASDLRSGKHRKDTVMEILANSPDTYYWYGNPLNWSDCYEIKLNELKEIAIRKCQFLLLESNHNVIKKLIAEDDISDECSMWDILLIYKGGSPYNYTDDIIDSPEYPYPAYKYECVSGSHVQYNLFLENMIENYKTNVSIKNGYNIEIQKLWDEYNELNDKKQRIIKWKDLFDYKVMESEAIYELNKKFLTEYKEKVNKLKEEN